MPYLALDKRGRIQLSREMRAQLGLKPGDTVYVEQRTGEIAIQPSRDPYAHLSGHELLEAYARWAREHPEEMAAQAEELEKWQAIPWDGLAEEDWSAEIAAAQQRGDLDRAV